MTEQQLIQPRDERDAEFEAWRDSLDPKHWARYDLAACRLGWDAARASHGRYLGRDEYAATDEGSPLDVDLSPAEGEPVGWRETVTEIRDRCSRRPALSGARKKDEILSRALSNSADLAKIMDLCNALLRQRHASPSNPVISDADVHLAIAWLNGSIGSVDPDRLKSAAAKITAALSAKPQ